MGVGPVKAAGQVLRTVLRTGLLLFNLGLVEGFVKAAAELLLK
jgi:hypothetical protein